MNEEQGSIEVYNTHIQHHAAQSSSTIFIMKKSKEHTPLYPTRQYTILSSHTHITHAFNTHTHV
jgi:hypothetical protein